MSEKEYMLSRDFARWEYYATTELGMKFEEAKVMWCNKHHIGKYLICEAREDRATRLYLRDVTNLFKDALNKEGWWNTFTVTKRPVNKGMWIAKVEEYRLDRNGYVNLQVEPVLFVDNIKMLNLFANQENGTWNSIAWWLMMVCSDAFLEEYHFHADFIRTPNFEALYQHFPELQGLSQKQTGQTLLDRYLRDEVSLEEIEECLNTPTEWEKLVSDVTRAVARNTVEQNFGERYPLFTKKVSGNVVRNGIVGVYAVEDYLNRQITYYNELVSKQEIEPASDNSPLGMVETALQHRKALKDAQKLAKKNSKHSNEPEIELDM